MLIVYGSLYPWHFSTEWRSNAALAMFRIPAMNRFVLRDLIVNITMYVPLGAAGYLAFHKRGKLPAIVIPICLGALLSFAVESAQFYTPYRMPSIVDVLCNTAGAIAGVAVAVMARDFVPSIRRPAKRERIDVVAAALLFCGIAYLLFPFFPLLSQAGIARKWALFAALPRFTIIPFGYAAVGWFVGCHLMVAATALSRKKALLLAVIAMPAQVFVLGRQPLPSMLLGAVAGLVMFWFVPTPRWALFAAAATVAILVIRGLSPFEWQSTATPFTFTPFGGVLRADWQNGILILIEKSFYYGSAVWSLTRARARLSIAVAAMAALMTCVEIAQMYLPGHTPEITDPLMILLAGFIMSVLGRLSTSQIKTVNA